MKVDKLKESARGKWLDILTDVCGIDRMMLDGKAHPCPKCGGKDRFRLIDAEAGAVLCNQCFSEKNGDGISAVRWATGKSFVEACGSIAGYLGLSGYSKGEKSSPAEAVSPREWNDGLVGLWTQSKKGITPEAVKKNGGQLADWEYGKKKYLVVALPIVGPSGSTKLPRGWVIYNQTGAELPTKTGTVKVRVTTGSQKGWVGSDGLSRIKDAATVWKVEGVSDLLALWSAIPESERATNAVITNPAGAKQVLPRNLLAPLVAKNVVVVADNDSAGTEGAEKWGAALAKLAASCRVCQAPGGGKDLRDFFNAGGTFAQLKEHVSEESESVQVAEAPEGVETLLMDDDCPMRLAIEFERYRLGRIRFWRDDFYEYKDGCWSLISSSDARQYVVLFLMRLFRQECEAKSDGGKDATMRKITGSLVSDVLGALRARAGVSSSVEWFTKIVQDDEGIWRKVDSERESMVVTFQNGTLDVGKIVKGLTYQELAPQDEAWWSPHVLPYQYNPKASFGRYWESFLRINLDGDESVAQLLQEWMGYCLTPWTIYQKALVLEGEGANGKSVFQAVLKAIVGPANVSHVGIDLLGERFQLSELDGKLVNITDEVGKLDSVAEGKVRAIVSGQPVSLEKKGRDPISVSLPCKMCIAWNEPPRLRDKTEATWRRLMIVRLNHRIPEGERIPGMDSVDWWTKGPGAGELPGIFNWALEGLARLVARGSFEEPESVRETVSEFRSSANPTQKFLLDHVELGEKEDSIPSADLYSQYSKWMKDNGYLALGESTFGSDIRRVFPGVVKKRTWIQTQAGPARIYTYSGIRRPLAPGFFEFVGTTE